MLLQIAHLAHLIWRPSVTFNGEINISRLNPEMMPTNDLRVHENGHHYEHLLPVEQFII